MTDQELYPIYRAAIEELGVPPLTQIEFIREMQRMSPTAHAHYHRNLMKLADPAKVAQEVDEFLATIDVAHPEPQ